MQAALSAITLLAITLAATLLPKYLERRVTGAVDVTIGKTLAEHRHTLDRQLEDYRNDLTAQLEVVKQTLAFQRERFSQDYGLFAARRNEIYAETYSLLERARGAFGAHFSALLVTRDFGRSPEPDLRHLASYLTRISEDERAGLLALLDSARVREAGALGTQLFERDALRRAQDDFSAFRNASVIHSLYFSVVVEEIVTAAMQPLALLSVFADERIAEERYREGRDYRRSSEAMKEVDSIVGRLRRQMREEMRAGFASPTLTVPT